MVVTSCYDHSSTTAYSGIRVNQWNSVTLAEGTRPIQVYYADETIDLKTWQQLLQTQAPAIVYLNNIYSSRFFRQPLNAMKSMAVQPKLVICPRGMLQKGALAVKPVKKKIYLTYLRLAGLLNNACWHATNQEGGKSYEL